CRHVRCVASGNLLRPPRVPDDVRATVGPLHDAEPFVPRPSRLQPCGTVRSLDRTPRSSRRPYRGRGFRLSFPSQNPPRMSLRILIVDDEADARENLRFMLGEHCPEVEVVAMAANAQEAREMIAAHQPNGLL